MTEPAIDKVPLAQGTSGVADANGSPLNGSQVNRSQVNGGEANGHVIDLRETPTTRVRVSRDNNPFAALSPAERMKLIIRVLCEIVAYGEIDEEPAQTSQTTTSQTTTSETSRPDPVEQPDHPAITT